VRLELRPATADDADAIAEVYLRCRRELMPYAPLVHPEPEIRDWIRHVVIPTLDARVALLDGELVGYVVLSRGLECGWIEHLYVLPQRIGQGIGRRLLDDALATLAPPIRLYTFQANALARRFYERLGFRAIALGDGSDNEEQCPDVLYEWTPK
jgi:ribosomal protein S18 acetylase RimI-like enzyme